MINKKLRFFLFSLLRILDSENKELKKILKINYNLFESSFSADVSPLFISSELLFK